MDLSQNTTLRELPVESLRENPWNPNSMLSAQFAALVAEVKRLGRVPKPVVVRRAAAGDDAYEILDGAHGWRAAKEAGLQQVLCDVVEADDFESRLRTFKLNEHGTHDPVAEGRMFAEMIRLKDISRRGLAEALGVSEGHVRNRLAYAQAADVRKACAPDTADRDIGDLPVVEVGIYLQLPPVIRDKWLASGVGPRVKRFDVTFAGLGTAFADLQLAGLEQFIQEDGNFLNSVDALLHLAHLGRRLKTAGVQQWQDCVQAVAKLGLPAEVVEAFPMAHQDGQSLPLFTLSEWEGCLTAAHTHDPFSGLLEVQRAVHVILRERGVDPLSVISPERIITITELATAPDYIRTAPGLNDDERLALLRYGNDREDADDVDQAKRMVVQRIGHERSEDPHRRPRPDAIYGRMCTALRAVKQLKEKQAIEELADSRDAAARDVRAEHLQVVSSPKRSARQATLRAIRRRIQTLQKPERALVLGALRGVLDQHLLGEMWVEMSVSEVPTEEEEKEEEERNGKATALAGRAGQTLCKAHSETPPG